MDPIVIKTNIIQAEAAVVVDLEVAGEAAQVGFMDLLEDEVVQTTIIKTEMVQKMETEMVDTIAEEVEVVEATEEVTGVVMTGVPDLWMTGLLTS